MHNYYTFIVVTQNSENFSSYEKFCHSELYSYQNNKCEVASMKILSRTIALASAAVMAVSCFGLTAGAAGCNNDDTVDFEYGWTIDDGNWEYSSSESDKAVYCIRKIDGVVYRFDEEGKLVGKYTGWAKSDGVRRRYSDGAAYTGWLKCTDGLYYSYRYCLDGYVTAEDMQLGDYICSFTDDGFHIDRTKCGLSASCSKYVAEDVENIEVTLKNLDKYGAYEFGVIDCMERWEQGRWVNCFEEWVGENGEVLAYEAIGHTLENGGTMTLKFNPQLYTNYNLTPGHYRIPVDYWTDDHSVKFFTYANFEVLPTVRLNAYEDDIRTDSVFINLEINSQNIKYDIDDIDCKLYKMTENGWELLDISEDIIETAEVTEEEYVYGFRSVFFETDITDYGAGYYKAVVTMNGANYEKCFRIDGIYSEPKQALYKVDNGRLTVELDIYNLSDRNVEMMLGLYDICQNNDGKWSDPEYARIAYVDCEPAIVMLESGGKHTAKINVGECYDVEKLKSGEYAVYIGGCGYVSFNIET